MSTTPKRKATVLAGQQALRQRNNYTGQRSVYDVPKGTARPNQHHSPPEKYPWAEWFDRAKRGTITLTRGTDFECTVVGMAGQLRHKADKRGLAIKTKMDKTAGTVTLEVWGVLW